MKSRVWMVVACWFASCAAEKQAPPKKAPVPDAGSLSPDAGKPPVVYSYVDDFGKIRMVASLQDVPQAYRDQVVITDTSSSRKERLAADRILVVDLRKERDGQPLNYSVIDLDSLKRRSGRHEDVRDAGDLGRHLVGKLADRVNRSLGLTRPAGTARVILYTAPWCGFCKKAARHLQARGVKFEEKDIEKDRSAAVELSRKLRQAGIPGSGVPVLDIGGTMVVGFNKQRIDKLLDEGK